MRYYTTKSKCLWWCPIFAKESSNIIKKITTTMRTTTFCGQKKDHFSSSNDKNHPYMSKSFHTKSLKLARAKTSRFLSTSCDHRNSHACQDKLVWHFWGKTGLNIFFLWQKRFFTLFPETSLTLDELLHCLLMTTYPKWP